MSLRNYTNTATEATLSGAISATDTSFTLTSFSGFPAAPFTAALERGTENEEIVLITAVSVATVTATRGYDGTTAKSHAAGGQFLHVVVAKDYTEANQHVNATVGVHGVDGTLVGTTDAQTLTNKTLTNPVLASPSVTGTATLASAILSGGLTVNGITNLAALAATGNGSIGGTFSVTGATTLAALTAASASITGNATVGGTLTVTGAATLSTGTASGVLTGAGLESTADLSLVQQASDPAGVAGKGKVWAKNDGGLYTRQGTGNVARLPISWGSGTVLPTTGVLTGDTFLHTGLGCLMRYVSSTWVQDHRPTVADATARNAISSAYASAIYPGFEVWQTDVAGPVTWNGTGWSLRSALGGRYVKLTGAAGSRQTLATAVSGSTLITFDLTERADTTLFTVSGGQLTCVTPGRYLLGGRVMFVTSGSLGTGAQRYAGVFVNGAQVNASAQGNINPTGDNHSQYANASAVPTALSAGDVLGIYALQDSGSNQSIALDSSFLFAQFLDG